MNFREVNTFTRLNFDLIVSAFYYEKENHSMLVFLQYMTLEMTCVETLVYM